MHYRTPVCMLSILSMCMLCAPARADDDVLDPFVFSTPASEYLKSLPRNWAGANQLVHSDYDCRTYEDKNIDRLTLSFAMRAAAFLRAFRDVHEYYTVETVTITSAHRSVE